MHSWFTEKLNELTAVAHYCQFPIAEAHFILSQTAVNDIYDKNEQSEVAFERLLSLMVMHAESTGKPEVAAHLQNALDALTDQTGDHHVAENVISVDFQRPSDISNRFGA